MSISVKVYSTDTADEIAKKIFNEFDVMASCSVYGFVKNDEEGMLAKGEAVLKSLEILYEMEYMDNKGKRKYNFRKDSIGGPIAHKIFTWEKRIVDNDVRYTIWRLQ